MSWLLRKQEQEKTAGFTLYQYANISGRKTLKSKTIRALILTPTRELAAQTC
jgi:superfamily II DNA/RNA helicase